MRHCNERRTHSALGNRPPIHRVREVTGHNTEALGRAQRFDQAAAMRDELVGLAAGRSPPTAHDADT